ncbi:PREDICTED: protocadherin gamma-B4-like, partial [Priapulus caudatus]|uniref:Protocadherin gamma-B4-like n=1 Tax=Priapulus caudatus TaxID=37621 RepID=A0ABM1F7H1_PRICU
VITARTPIDFELMDPNTQGATSPWYRSFSLVAMAIDHGVPPLNSTVPVTIYVEDVNDNSPIFNPDAYEVVVDETVAAGTHITRVSATDADPTPYNGAVSYRLDGVGIDKFAIDAVSGEVTVAPNAKLDLMLT